MKKTIIKIIAILFSVAMLFSFVACNGEKPKDSGTSFTEYDFITDGKSDYKIVYPANTAFDGPLYRGVRELKRFVEEATGVSLPVTDDSGLTYSEDVRYLSIGKTAVFQSSGVGLDEELLGPSGLRLKTKGRSVFMVGASDFGSLYAAYEFLSRTFHFEPYSQDEIALDRNVTSIKLPDLDVTDVPTFDYRIAKYGIVTGDLVYWYRSNWEGQIITAVNGKTFHNSFAILPPEKYKAQHSDWYSQNGIQICYRAHGNAEEYTAMVETASEVLFQTLLANKSVNGISFMHEDDDDWCGCSYCSESKVKYGTDSATAIMFLNDLAESTNGKLKAVGDNRDITYWLFAYLATTNAPVVKDANGKYTPVDEKVDMKKNNIGVVYAPILMDYTKSMEHVNNTSYADIISQWGALTDNVFFWGYDTVFSNYFAFQNTFGTIQTNLKIMAENNVNTVMLQGQYDTRNSSCFNNFKTYMTAKLEWNVNADYNELFNNFFDNYFKDASETMKKLFTYHTTHFAWFANEFNVFCQGANDTVREEYYPKGTLNTWMGLIEQAYKDIEGLKTTDPIVYEKVYDRITLESLAYRYMLITLYGSNYLDSELEGMKLSFRSDCGTLGVTNYIEHKTIDGLWASWGLA